MPRQTSRIISIIILLLTIVYVRSLQNGFLDIIVFIPISILALIISLLIIIKTDLKHSKDKIPLILTIIYIIIFALTILAIVGKWNESWDIFGNSVEHFFELISELE